MKILDFLSGWKTKIGAAGALLALIANVLVALGGLELEGLSLIDKVSAVLDVLKQGFIGLGGYGMVMKLIKWWDAKFGKGSPEPLDG